MEPEPTPADVAASFCATVVDEWVRAGVATAIVCPGSRSTPVALALEADGRIDVQVHHDERAAAFVALGVGLATGVPAVVVTTSGTAAAELLPAVVEADLSCVPLLAVTADRPPEAADVGAAQTIDQRRLFGRRVRLDEEPGVPVLATSGTWRARAARVVLEAVGALGGRPGPVHLDLAFREPLVGRPVVVPPGRAHGAPWLRAVSTRPTVDREGLDVLVAGARRGLVVAGAEPGTRGVDAAATARRVAGALGWPLLVDARLRGATGPGDASSPVVTTADSLLRHRATADALGPDVVLHLGMPPASRVVGEWLASSGAAEVRVGAGRWTDPHHTASVTVDAPADSLLDVLGSGTGSAVEDGWVRRWATADAAAREALDVVLDGRGPGGPGDPPTEPGVARSVAGALEHGEALVVSSSMPVRDVEGFVAARLGVEVVSNRGANGIDGVVSTAVGVALGRATPTACLVGDVALLHDSNGLLGAVRRGIDLTVVVVDNDGGGIFSFLPQAADPGGDAFERLFGTPHGVDLALLAAAHGVPATEATTASEVAPVVRSCMDAGGVHLVRVRTARAANVALHERLHAAVADALDAL